MLFSNNITQDFQQKNNLLLNVQLKKNIICYFIRFKDWRDTLTRKLLRSNPINFKAMEKGIKMLTKLHQNTEKLQEGQAASLNVLIKLQTQA